MALLDSLSKIDLTKIDLTKIDVRKIDVSRLAQLDPTKIDLTKIDLAAIGSRLDPRQVDFGQIGSRLPSMPSMPQVDLPTVDWSKVDLSGLLAERGLGDLDDKVVSILKDAVYISIGFGVLAVQKAQVRRRELADQVGERIGATREQVESLLSGIEDQIKSLAGKRA